MVFESSYFFCSDTRRSASAASAAAFVLKPDSVTRRRSSRPEAGASKLNHQVVLPERYLRLKTGMAYLYVRGLQCRVDLTASA